MASGLYDNYKDLMLGVTGAAHTLPAWDTSLIKVGIVALEDYTVDFNLDHDWDDVGTYTINASYGGEINQTLSNILVTDGAVDNEADITFVDVEVDTTKDIDALVHYFDSTVITTSPLMTYHDGFTEIRPNGGSVVIAYDPAGIFEL